MQKSFEHDGNDVSYSSMKVNLTVLAASSLFLSVLLAKELECRCCQTRQSRAIMYEEEELGSEKFVTKWLGNVSELELRAEWSTWKATHRKFYSSSVQDLERYVVWRSNKAYINYHNSFANTFGFLLAMNKFGDMVRTNLVHPVV